jgi:hypothetical protein
MVRARTTHSTPSSRMPSTVWPAHSIAAIARVEGRSAPLRDLPRGGVEWRRHGRLLVRRDVEHEKLPIRLAIGEGEPWRGQVPVAADAILLSTLPGARVSCRAFYLDARLTVTVRSANLSPSRLLRGSRVAARFHGDGPLVVPRQVDRGRRLHLAWVVEELLAGASASRRRWPSLIDRVSDGVVSLWRRADTEKRGTRRIVPWLTAVAVAECVEALGVAPIDAGRLAQAVGELERTVETCLVGWTHGDPVPNNVLELQDGRLALVDWERAGRNPLGLDACRLLAALEDPDGAIERLERRFASIRPSGVLPIRQQAAVALIGLLPTWAGQREAWHAAGRETGYRVRNARRVRLLERLLAISEPTANGSDPGGLLAAADSD